MPPWTQSTLDALPRLGWIEAPTPVTELPEQAAELGFSWFGVKRDDQLGPLQGGNKVRKLDFLLAQEPFASAQTWASVGAIGSGHLVAMTLAAARLGRRLEAHCFWEPVSEPVLENLACIASGPTDFFFCGSRLELAFRCTRVLLGKRDGPIPAIPPGGTVPEGVVGSLAGGLELAAQIEAGEIPEPDVVFVPWGTGGTAVGTALGLALAGRPIPVRAVATVERIFVTNGALRRHRDQVLAFLRSSGLPVPAYLSMPDLKAVRGFVGPGYGHISPDSADAVAWLGRAGLRAEPIYGGKALAAMRAEAPAWAGKRVMYWLTSHRGDLPTEPGWRGRLPEGLLRRLDSGRGWSRRRVLVGGAVLAVGIAGYRHLVGYGGFEDWDGLVLSRHEALAIAAAAEAVVPDEPGPLPVEGPSGQELATAVDRYLAGMPAPMLLEVHGMFELLEQGTALNGNLSRLTQLDPAARRRFLERLEWFGGLMADAARGVRDLCLLGWYQDARTWGELGYRGPWVPPGGTGVPGRYAALVAPAGQDPRGALR